MKESLGELSEKEWEVIFRPACHSLLAKGLLTGLDDKNLLECLEAEYRKLIKQLGVSKTMLRGYKKENNQQYVLTIHNINSKYIYHTSLEGLIHHIGYIPQKDILDQVDVFFSLQLLETSADFIYMSEQRFKGVVEEDCNSVTDNK
ncbi:hypothetical protein MUG87_19110 [Ectobacillus sp. JY-23]|uniref:hypothetical protein n=1 Tax=Ectobacillus sp. JY-23 TaxID=2933872 RepID=UPI001FF3B18F|nr:hypothetical protein [Ectobacillus sp. JY-23]UOY92494.1 hypothetical protein MUG87_19110 [Ectobacillus sp. JY-23]